MALCVLGPATDHRQQRKDIVQKFPLLSRCILNMLVEGECSEITAADLKTVFKDPSESPPVAHIRDPMILRMLIDALFNSSGTLSACRKTDILYILSYAVCAKDPRDVSETTQGDVAVKLIDFDKTMQYLEQASDICNSDHTLGYNVRCLFRLEMSMSHHTSFSDQFIGCCGGVVVFNAVPCCCDGCITMDSNCHQCKLSVRSYRCGLSHVCSLLPFTIRVYFMCAFPHFYN